MSHDAQNSCPTAATEQETQKQALPVFLFEVFCAVIFLSMIGLVFYNAMLRYCFGSSYPPSEEWARFLFMYITFFGAIEAFYYKKHIAVDLFVDMLSGISRKTVDIIALIITMGVQLLLLLGGFAYVELNVDSYSVATNVNMVFIYCILPIMAFAALAIHIRDLIALIRRPASSFVKEEKEVV